MPLAQSAGVLLYRRRDGLEVLLVHPGGPFWARKDQGAWSIPKGELAEGEDPLEAAIREFAEETGQHVTGNFIALDPLRQPGGKLIHAWAVEADFDPADFVSNDFSMEWPPRSGQLRTFPEVDRLAWFGLPAARDKMIAYQLPFLTQLEELLTSASRRLGTKTS